MKPDGPRLLLRAVAFGFLLLLVAGQGEAPAQGGIGTGVGRPNSAEAGGVGVGVVERVLASGRWEPLERYSTRTVIPRISASPEARKSLACPKSSYAEGQAGSRV